MKYDPNYMNAVMSLSEKSADAIVALLTAQHAMIAGKPADAVKHLSEADRLLSGCKIDATWAVSLPTPER
jgi:hypothetical protein